MEIPEQKIFSVSEFIQLLNIGLKRSRVKIVGEVTQSQAASSGHVYFTLKDETDGAVLSCIMWKSRYGIYGIKLEMGMKIIAQGYPEVYAASGRLSFIAETIQLAGEGELKKQYEELKKKLTAEGLFAPERKRSIPQYCQKIGVITSKHGAVLADFLNNLGKFGFKIKMIDARVEGQEAVEDLLSAVRTFENQDIETLVIIRGGGSPESLMAFNNETLVREVADFRVPVIAGVGHHQDEPLITLAADASVSTPTAAANYLNRSWQEALLLLEKQERIIFGFFEEIFETQRAAENKLMIFMQNFKAALANLAQRLSYAEKVITLNSPQRQLSLGYSLAYSKGKIIRSIREVSLGQELELQLGDGRINSEVKKIIK